MKFSWQLCSCNVRGCLCLYLEFCVMTTFEGSLSRTLCYDNVWGGDRHWRNFQLETLYLSNCSVQTLCFGNCSIQTLHFTSLEVVTLERLSCTPLDTAIPHSTIYKAVSSQPEDPQLLLGNSDGTHVRHAFVPMRTFPGGVTGIHEVMRFTLLPCGVKD